MYDMVFISYSEPNAEDNWTKLKTRFSLAKRVHGVKGIHQAHIFAAKKALTNMFWVIDGDAEILDTFDFNFRIKQYDTVYVWRSLNPINDLEYGNGGVKLLPRTMTINMDTSKPDMTTSISNKFVPMHQVSNITRFNTDEFNTWKSAFRECAKLASKIIDRQKVAETEYRLDTWCKIGKDRTYGIYALEGAIQGKAYGLECMSNKSNLSLINDFEWLRSRFNLYYETERIKQ
jgi:hypothetical protein